MIKSNVATIVVINFEYAELVSASSSKIKFVTRR
jgi:hypothetical protein